MRVFVFLCGFAVLAFGGYWFGMAYLIPSLLNAHIARHPDLEGQVQKVTGFPRRFDLVVESPMVRHATAATEWRSARLIAEGFTLAPNRMRLSLPMSQHLMISGADVQIDSAGFVADILLALDLSLAEATVGVDGLELSPPLPIGYMKRLRAKLAAQDGPEYTLALEGSDIALAPAVLGGIGPDAGLSGTVTSFTLDAVLGFEGPLALVSVAPALRQIEIRAASLLWDDLHMRLSGDVKRDSAGALDGEMVLVVSNFAPLPRALVASGVITPDMGGFLAMFLAGQADPVTGEVALPLVLRKSVLSLGPFAVLELPLL